MEFEFFAPTLALILSFLQWFLNSWLFAFIKFLLAIYSIVLFADIVLLLVLRGLGGDLRDAMKGAHMPLVSKKKMCKRWEQIEDRIKDGDIVQIKIAILEADKMADEILSAIGCSGKNMKEKLEAVNANQIEDKENLLEGHEVRNKIIHDDKLELEKTEAERVIGIYRDFLENLDII